MKRKHERWRQQFPDKKRIAQNLVDNAKNLAKKGWEEKEQTVTLTVVKLL